MVGCKFLGLCYLFAPDVLFYEHAHIEGYVKNSFLNFYVIAAYYYSAAYLVGKKILCHIK